MNQLPLLPSRAGIAAIGTQLQFCALRTPNKVAIELTSGPKRTYGELDERSNRLANSLLGKGLVKGDRVAIWLTNTLEYMDSYIACAKAGLVIVQINIRHKPAEAQYQLENSGSKAIIFCDAISQYVDELNLAGDFLTVTTGKVHVKGSVSFETFLTQGANVMPPAPEDDDLLVIGYTSGTTGFPKGAELTHHSVKTLGQANALTNRYAMASTQVFGLSLSFTAGIPAHVLTHIWVGGTTVLMDEWDTELLVESIAKHQATFTIIPSPPIVEFCAIVDKAPKKVESLVAFLHSSSKAPPEHLAMLVNSLGPRLVEGLGMTENSGGLIAATRASDYINPRPDIFESTGIAAPDTIVDIIDEDGNLLPHDGEAVGQLVAHSGSLARGYWGNPEATAKSFVNGWYNTGDLGRITPDGYIYMIDRRNDLISSGGMNVYPSEIERVILTVPGVTLCAVVAAPHEKWGQTPVAFVISNSDSLSADAIKEVCSKELANYKLPSEIRIVKQLPTNTSGKILKHELRNQLENEKENALIKSTQVTTAEPGISFAVVLGLMAGFCSLLSAGAAVVLPKMATDINISTTLSVWVISGFSLAYGVTMAAYGRIADLVGLRLPLTVGTIFMSIGALIAALASNFGILMVGRVLQGVGGAAVPVLGVAIVSSFNDKKLKTTGLALVTGLSSAGAGIGPLVGGLLEYVGTWRLSIGITACNLILLAMIWKQIPHKKSAAKFDLVGSLLFTGVATGLVAIIQSVSTGMMVRIIGSVLMIATLPALLIWVKGHPTGFLPVSVYKNKEAMRATFATISIPAAWFSTLVAVPIYLHSQGLEPIEIGIVVAPSGLIGFLSAKYSAQVIAKIGANRTLIFAAFCSISALLIAFYGSHFAHPYVMAVSIYMVTLGFGMAQPAMVNRINQVVTEDVRGIALGIAIMTIFVIGSIAAAIIGGFSDVLGIDYTLLCLLVVPIFVLALIWPTKNRPRW